MEKLCTCFTLLLSINPISESMTLTVKCIFIIFYVGQDGHCLSASALIINVFHLAFVNSLPEAAAAFDE